MPYGQKNVEASHEGEEITPIQSKIYVRLSKFKL